MWETESDLEYVKTYFWSLCLLVGVSSYEKCVLFVNLCACLWKRLSVCGDNWSPLAPVGLHWCEPLAAVWFDTERCVLFYHSQVLLWKRGVTTLLKPEPSSDLFVDLWRKTQNNEQFYPLPPYFYFHLTSTRGKVCWSRMLFCSSNILLHIMEFRSCSIFVIPCLFKLVHSHIVTVASIEQRNYYCIYMF